MIELFKEALAQIPKFFATFASALAGPRTFVLDIGKATAKTARTESTNEAFLFLAFCLLVTALCKSAIFGEAGSTPIYLAKDALWKATIVMAAAGVMKVAWKTVGGKMTYAKYVICNCYFFGILSVLMHIVLLVGKKSFGSIAKLTAGDFILFYVCMLAPLMFWALSCWRAYGDLNRATFRQTVVALIVFIVLGSPALIFSYALRFALIGHVFRDWF